MVQHEQLEEHFFEIHKRGDRLFTRLYDVWHEDEELMDIIEQDRIELMTNKRKIINDLREKKNEMLKEKRELSYAEEELYDLKRAIDREEEA